MTDRRGGARVPDGRPRPASLPFARGPNRSDMSELPGTPGTPLPPSPAEPQIHQGQAGRLREMLGNVPLEQLMPGGGINDPSQSPDEPVTAGVEGGMGAGPESLLPSPNELTSQLSSADLRYAYPLILRLATMPNATTETRILAQRIRANLPVPPEQMPYLGQDNGADRQP